MTHASPPEHPNILILTPVKDASSYLEGYCRLVQHLDWPKSRLSIGLLEGDSIDKTWDRLQSLRPALEERCASVTLIKRDYGFRIPASLPRWEPALQLARRTILARARNQLLFRALRAEDWVLWLDVDVIDYPADIIQQLLAPGLDIVHPNCVRKYGGSSFDHNAWADHGAVGLSDLRGQSAVRLDAVGGTMLLVRADIHREGLIFPAFKYGVANPKIRPKHPVWGAGEIETEGLGIMAADMGYQCWGLPGIEILHA